MDMTERIQKINILYMELADLDKIADYENKNVRRQQVCDELALLSDISIGSIPEYAVWAGDNKAELDSFISHYAVLDRSGVVFDNKKGPVYWFETNGKYYELKILEVISDDCGFFRPTVDNITLELDIVGKSLIKNGTDELLERFKEQISPLNVIYTGNMYVNKETNERVSAIQWTGRNFAEISRYLHAFEIERWGESTDYGYTDCMQIFNNDTEKCIELPVGSYLIKAGNSVTNEVNIVILGVGLYTSPSTLPRYVYEVIGEKDFNEQWLIKEQWDKEQCSIVVNGSIVIIPRTLIDDLMCTALEGGITYWCCRAEVPKEEGYKGTYASDQVSRGGSLLLYDNEDEAVYTLDLETFLKGMTLYFEQGYGTVEEVVMDEYYDAETADAIVQMALFGDIQYG